MSSIAIHTAIGMRATDLSGCRYSDIHADVVDALITLTTSHLRDLGASIENADEDALQFVVDKLNEVTLESLGVRGDPSAKCAGGGGVGRVEGPSTDAAIRALEKLEAENVTLQRQVAELEVKHFEDVATIRVLEERNAELQARLGLP